MGVSNTAVDQRDQSQAPKSGVTSRGQAAGGLLMVLSALGFATNPILGKFAYQAGANAITLGMVRFSTAATVLVLYLAIQGRLGGLTVAKRLKLMILGAGGVAMVALLYFTALMHINASLATGLFYCYPAMVAVAGLFRGEALTSSKLAGLALTIAGTWLLLGDDLGGFSWQGVFLILASAVVYTGYLLMSDRWADNVAPDVASAHVITGAAIVYLVLEASLRSPLPHLQAYFSGAGLAFSSTILALITLYAGMARVGPTRAAIISTLEPVFTAIMALLLLGERLGVLQVVGIALVVFGAVAAQWRPESR
ncbi:MAG: DMT family transporter [Mycobacterium leprae]